MGKALPLAEGANNGAKCCVLLMTPSLAPGRFEMTSYHRVLLALAAMALGPSIGFAHDARATDHTSAAARLSNPADTGLSGHWEGNMTSEDKTFAITFDLHVTGTMVTGTVEIPSLDRVVQIKEGTIKGNAFSFKGSGLWTGTLAGDRLTLTRGMDYGKKQHMIAHRVAQP